LNTRREFSRAGQREADIVGHRAEESRGVAFAEFSDMVLIAYVFLLPIVITCLVWLSGPTHTASPRVNQIET